MEWEGKLVFYNARRLLAENKIGPCRYCVQLRVGSIEVTTVAIERRVWECNKKCSKTDNALPY